MMIVNQKKQQRKKMDFWRIMVRLFFLSLIAAIIFFLFPSLVSSKYEAGNMYIVLAQARDDGNFKDVLTDYVMSTFVASGIIYIIGLFMEWFD